MVYVDRGHGGLTREESDDRRSGPDSDGVRDPERLVGSNTACAVLGIQIGSYRSLGFSSRGLKCID
jgi:hypothetical protein